MPDRMFDGAFFNGPPQTVNDPILRLEIDIASETVTYKGLAPHGSADADTAWLIQRITTDVDGNASIKHASTQFDQVWDDRAALSYA